MNIRKDYLTVNKYSRPATPLKRVRGVVVHWVANKNTTAEANRNFFEGRKAGNSGFGSAHYIINLDGSIVQCLPENELGYHVGSSLPYNGAGTQVYTPIAWQKLNSKGDSNLKPYPNDCTIGIECTHIDDYGKMTLETYAALVYLCADILKRNNLTYLDLYLHKEVVGWKNCHKWFVDNAGQWKRFKLAVKEEMEGKTPTQETPKPDQPSKGEDEEMSNVSMTDVSDSQKITGKAALKSLTEKGIINTQDFWIGKMGEAAPNWLVFELINRAITYKEGAK